MKSFEIKNTNQVKPIIDLDRARPAFWQRTLARLYETPVALRLKLYRKGLLKSGRLPVRVICVGNLTVGGTGKTPMVITVVGRLLAAGIKPAVLSRGYGGKSKDPIGVVSDGEKVLLDSESAGDEPRLLAEALPGVPVLVGKDRYAAGRYAIDRFGVTALVLDDGYQHIRLYRDVNLLLLDGQAPWGNGYLLPAGRLREPVRGADRAAAFILTRTGRETSRLREELNVAYPGRPVFVADRRPCRLKELGSEATFEPDYLRGREITAFCGLANPRSFYDTLTSLGALVREFTEWPDHYRPTEDDLAEISEKTREKGIRDCVTTAKDAVKLAGRKLGGRESVRIVVLEIEMDILNDREIFDTMIAGDRFEVGD